MNSFVSETNPLPFQTVIMKLSVSQDEIGWYRVIYVPILVLFFWQKGYVYEYIRTSKTRRS